MYHLNNMKYKSLTISKSKTVGIMTPDGRTKFKKIVITAGVELEDKDNHSESYMELSKFIEEQFEYEKTIK